MDCARPVRRRLPALLVGGAVASVALVASVPSSPAAAAVVCAKYASPSGSDSAAGTQGTPLRSAQKLADSLSAGQVGCLQPGAVFGGVRFNRSGVTLTTVPGGAKATLAGQVWVPDATNDVTIENLVLDSRTSTQRVSPDIQGDRVVLRGNDITNEYTAICVHVGSQIGYGVAYDTVIDGNRIFRCGRLPATGHDHGIYVNNAVRTRITNNVIFDNADYAVQLYPGANGSHVANNVFDGNGRGITYSSESGLGSLTSSGNLVENNIITNSTITSNVESWWGGPVGVDNRFERNCVFAGRKYDIDLRNGGFTAAANLTADPMYVNRAAKDFTLRAGSPCAGKGPQAGAMPAPPPTTTPPNVAPTPRSRTSPGDRSLSQPMTPRQRQAGPSARLTPGQVKIQRAAVVRLLQRVGRLEAKVLGHRTASFPATLRTRLAVTPREMLATRRGAAEALRRITIVLNRASGRNDPVARFVGTRPISPTVAALRSTERLARLAVARAASVELILSRR